MILAAASGKQPDAAARIIDTKLSEIPELPIGDRDYNRRIELRISVRKQNERNRMDRYNITMRELTAVFSAIYEAAEQSAPMWARELREACDYSRIGTHNRFTRPRTIVYLRPPTGQKVRNHFSSVSQLVGNDDCI